MLILSLFSSEKEIIKSHTAISIKHIIKQSTINIRIYIFFYLTDPRLQLVLIILMNLLPTNITVIMYNDGIVSNNNVCFIEI